MHRIRTGVTPAVLALSLLMLLSSVAARGLQQVPSKDLTQIPESEVAAAAIAVQTGSQHGAMFHGEEQNLRDGKNETRTIQELQKSIENQEVHGTISALRAFKYPAQVGLHAGKGWPLPWACVLSGYPEFACVALMH